MNKNMNYDNKGVNLHQHIDFKFFLPKSNLTIKIYCFKPLLRKIFKI